MRPAAALTALAVMLVAVPAAFAAPGRTVFTKPVSGATPFAEGCGGPGNPTISSEVEPHLAVDPRDPSRILAAWQQDRHTLYGGARGNAGAVTLDGGRSFDRLVFPGLTTCGGGPRDRVTDPWVSYGADGKVYASHLTFDYLEPFASADLAGPTQVVAQTSTDGGRSYERPVTLVDEQIFDDRQAHVADPWRAGRAYMVWTRRLGAFGESGTTEFSKTEDGGRSWTPHRTIYVPGPGRLTIPALVNVLPNGTLVATMVVVEARSQAVDEPVPFEIVASRSTDGGATWSAVQRIGETISTEPQDPDGGGGLRALPIISTDVGPDGTVYTVWNRIDSPSASEISFVRSTDGGRSWSAPARVAAPRAQAFLPAVAVGADGTVGILWDDTRGDRRGDGAFTTDVWFAHSHDGGRSWDEQHVAGPFDSLTAAPTSSTAVAGRFLGDYQAVVPQPDGFAAVFPQARPAATAGASDAFFARLQTTSPATTPGLHLRVRPRRARAGRRTRFLFRVTRTVGRRRLPVARALVRFAGRRARTNRRGRAFIMRRLHRRGARRAIATKRGFRPGRTRVRVLRPRRAHWR